MGREENHHPCEVSSRGTAGISRRNHRHPAEDGGAAAECSGTGIGTGKYSCRSCTAEVIADCVAVCCCPCAVVNFFTLTFLKLPWMMGRKCLGGLGNKKKKKLKNDEKEKDRSGISRKEQGLDGKFENLIVEEEQKDSPRFEAEKVWLELYKVDQLGFGRVSFTGIPSLE